MIKILIWILATVISAILYRCGGVGKPYNTKFRDLGCPAISLLALFLTSNIHIAWWVYFITFGLMFASMISYYDTKNNEPRWWLVGLIWGLTALPYVFYTHIWVGALLRTVLLTLGVSMWSNKIDSVVWEEGGRGALFAGTLPLLFI